jgi:hypothetical protein
LPPKRFDAEPEAEKPAPQTEGVSS